MSNTLTGAIGKLIIKMDATNKENEDLKLILSVILQSHKKGHSVINYKIISKVKELLEVK